MKEKNFYEILGVEKDATTEQINKAYRKKAVQMHPDKFMTASEAEKNIATEKFKELNKIHEILNDPQKREDYDNYGEESLDEEFLQRKQAEQMFSQFGSMGGMGGFGSMFQNMMGGGQPSRKKTEIPNITIKIKTTLKDIYLNNKVEFEISYYSLKNSKEPTDKDIICSKCNGSGQKVELRKTGNMLQQVSSQCNSCKNGINFSDTFYELKKQKYAKAIPSGAINGQKIIIEGKGHDIPKSMRKNGKTKTDIILIIEDTGLFTIEDFKYSRGVNNSLYNLKLELKITPTEAICGTYKNIKFIDGSNICFKIPPATIFASTNNNVVVIQKKGLPISKQYTGDLYIVLNVEGDITIEENKLRQIWKILNNDEDMLVEFEKLKGDNKKIFESVKLEIYRNSREYKEVEYNLNKFQNNQEDEEDEERTFSGRGQPQCAQQ